MTDVTAERWQGRRYLVLAIMCLAELLVMIDNTIVNVALPTIAAELGANGSGLQWVVDAYTLVFAGLLLTGGYLADRFGRRPILMIGVTGFAAVSVLAALAPNLGALIGARAGLGVFAALVFPATLAIILVAFPNPKERAMAFGLWAATAGISVAIGPVAGGFLLEHFSWGSVFWVNLPVAIAVLLAVWLLIPREAPIEQAPGRFDAAGVLLSIGGIGALVWSLIEGPEHGWTSGASYAGFTLAAVLIVGFLVRELSITAPIIDVRLFRNRQFSVAAASVSIAFFGLFGFIFLITMYFQAVRGYGTLEAGLRTLPFAGVVAVCAPVSAILTKFVRPAILVGAGLFLMAIGFYQVTEVDADSSYWPTIVVSMAFMAGGLAFIQTTATEVIMNALPVAKAGAGSAVNDTTRELGGTLGVAVLGSVLSGVFATQTRAGLQAAHLEQFDELADHSVVAGLMTARQLPPEQAAPLVGVLRESFVTGLHHATWAAVAACVIGGVIAVIGLWRPVAMSVAESAHESTTGATGEKPGRPRLDDEIDVQPEWAASRTE